MRTLAVILMYIASSACCQEPKYSDYAECLNEEVKAGSPAPIAGDYCRRFVKAEGHGVRNEPFIAERGADGRLFVHVEGRKVVLEKTATNHMTGERLGLAGEHWIKIKIKSD